MGDTYRVILQPEAHEGMESGYAYIEQDSPEKAQQWTIGLMDAIMSLQTFPVRCPLAPEKRKENQPCASASRPLLF